MPRPRGNQATSHWIWWTAVALAWGCGGRSSHAVAGDDDAGQVGVAGSGGSQGGAGGGAGTGQAGSSPIGGTEGGGASGTGAAGGTSPGGSSSGSEAAGGKGGGASEGGIAAIGAGFSEGLPVGNGGTHVCGPNGCIREPDVMSIAPPGPILCSGVACGDGEVCCLMTGQCFDPVQSADACNAPPPNPDVGGSRPCASNADCNAIEFCQVDNPRLCQGPGHCAAIGNCGSCGDDGTGRCTVCACDGNTYPDFQTACLARTGYAAPWGAACGEAVDVDVGNGEGETDTRVVAVCGKDEECADDELCCSLTSRCYPKAEPGQCAQPPAGTSFPCTSNEQCGHGEYCQGDGCAGPGGCVQLDTEGCGVTLEPVCGCDGTTYTSAACASSQGVRVASEAECPK